MPSKKIAIAHYLTGERDGVSLEIEKRAQVAEGLGNDVVFITGHDGLKRRNAYIVPEMTLANLESVALKEQMFFKLTIPELELKERYYRLEEHIFTQLKKIWDSQEFDLLFVHNLFSHAFNLPATTALLRILDIYKTPTVCVHHDFWFERPKFIKPTTDFVTEKLNQIPPERPYILKHQVINSLSASALMAKRSIVAERIGDYFNFDKPLPALQRPSLKQKLGIENKDIVVLQATRITERKAIENAIRFVAALQKNLPDRKVWLLCSNFVEVDSHPYYEKLKNLAIEMNVQVLWKQELFQHEKFWDSYLISDIVTYPSIQEGFGNQFLEAIYFRKPVVMFEYEVYRKDIKPEGYRVISLGDTTKRENGFEFVPQRTINLAVDETISLLNSPAEIIKTTEHNFQIAREYHNETKLVDDMAGILNSLQKA